MVCAGRFSYSLTYRNRRNKSRTPKICYPKREGAVMPILFWDNKFLGCGFYFGGYGSCLSKNVAVGLSELKFNWPRMFCSFEAKLRCCYDFEIVLLTEIYNKTRILPHNFHLWCHSLTYNQYLYNKYQPYLSLTLLDIHWNVWNIILLLLKSVPVWSNTSL